MNPQRNPSRNFRKKITKCISGGILAEISPAGISGKISRGTSAAITGRIFKRGVKNSESIFGGVPRKIPEEISRRISEVETPVGLSGEIPVRISE